MNRFAFALSIGALLVGTIAGETPADAAPRPAPLPPRTDINPALFYWQAFSLFPNLGDEEKKEFLADPPTLSQPEGEHIAEKYDAAFKLLRRAMTMRAPCDWGIDPADGPNALMPNMVKIRNTVQTAQSRAHYALEAGRSQDAIDDLAAALFLGRYSGTDGALVSAMVGIAVEDRIIKTVAEQFDRFSPDSLRRLLKWLDAAPLRPTVRGAMAMEQAAFLGWFIRRIEELKETHRGDEPKAMAELGRLLRSVLGSSDATVDEILDASGQTTDGALAYFQQISPLYEDVLKLGDATPAKLEYEMDRVQKLISTHTNRIAQVIVPNVGRARKTELGIIARFAMLRAAIAHRLDGETAFRKIQDPFGNGPFVLKPLSGDSAGQGFELDSELSRYRTNTALRFGSAPRP